MKLFCGMRRTKKSAREVRGREGLRRGSSRGQHWKDPLESQFFRLNEKFILDVGLKAGDLRYFECAQNLNSAFQFLSLFLSSLLFSLRAHTLSVSSILKLYWCCKIWCLIRLISLERIIECCRFCLQFYQCYRWLSLLASWSDTMSLRKSLEKSTTSTVRFLVFLLFCLSLLSSFFCRSFPVFRNRKVRANGIELWLRSKGLEIEKSIEYVRIWIIRKF